MRSSRVQSSRKQAAAGGTRHVADKHNGTSDSILQTQNPVSKQRYLVKRGKACDGVHNQEAVRCAYFLVVYGAAVLLKKTRDSVQLADTLTRGAYSWRDFQDVKKARLAIDGELLAVPVNDVWI